MSDRQIAVLRAAGGDDSLGTEVTVAALRERLDVHPVYKTVDTCAAEFRSARPLPLLDLRDGPCRHQRWRRNQPSQVLILGSGPNRIGRGIEFDYSCVHAAMALSLAGYETVMVNCNPETVSTDYDTADRLYFEPLTFGTSQRVAGTVAGVIVQLGGQTPLGLAHRLADAGWCSIVGTGPDAIDLAEDRGDRPER